MPIAILSDLHNHDWSTYSKVDPDGVNSRLRITINETERAAAELRARGGTTMIIAGDIFHERGRLDPEVLNPVQDSFRRILDSGVTVYAIPGNHDLKTKETTELGSAIQTLSETFTMNGDFVVFNEPRIVAIGDRQFAFVPWFSTNEGLLKALEDIKKQAGADHDKLHVIIHAGIDGVVPGPEHGLTAKILADFGFRNVFAGHYHNRKNMGAGIWSIGATTHQSWRDVGMKAGFIMLNDDGTISEFDTAAPKFIDVSSYPEDEVELATPGNYVRFRGPPMTQKEIEEKRQYLLDLGALGVSIEAPIAIASVRSPGRSASAGAVPIDVSVQNYVDKMTLQPNVDRDRVKQAAADVLNTVMAATT